MVTISRASAAFFDPMTRQFTAFQPPFEAIADHLSVVMSDGRVVIDSPGDLPIVFDPVTGQSTGTSAQPGVSGASPAGGLLLATGHVFEARTSWAGALNASTLSWRDVSPTGGPLATDATLTLLRTGQVLAVGGTVAGQATATTRVWSDAPGTVSGGGIGLLSSARAGHAAVTLPDGDVFVVGGTETGLPAASRQAAERLDAVTRQWTTVAGVTHRSLPAAVALAGGKVLIVGGNADCPGATCPALATAELYDPVSGTVRIVTPMSQARAGATATRLGNGLVLVVGGEQPTNAETWDPASDTWAATPPLAVRRTQHTATLLSDGNVLVLGGTDGTTGHAIAERFNARSRTWTRLPHMPTPRVGHAAALLPDGRVLVVGGNTAAGAIGNVSSTAIVWSPVSGQWTAAASMGVARIGHGAAPLSDGRVIVAGGDSNVAPSIEIYSPLADRWQRVTTVQPRGRPSISVLPSGAAAIVGGVNVQFGNALLADTIVFSPAGANPPRDPVPAWPASLVSGAANVPLTGLRLTPAEPGDGGRRTSSPSDVPLLWLQRIDGGAAFAPGARTFGPTSLTFDVPTATVGLYLGTVSARGVPGGGIVRIGNTPPAARDSSVRTPEDTSLPLVLSGGDRDGDDVTYTIDAAPSSGVLSGAAPSLSYAPQRDFAGTDTFTFRVSDGAQAAIATVRITVDPVNDAPVAVEDVISTDEDTALVLPAAQGVLGNDTDVDSPATSLRARLVRAANGQLQLAADGSLSYLPLPDMNGEDVAEYVASDGLLDSAPARIRIIVRPVNDTPVAVGERFEGTEDRTLEPRTSVLDNDSDVDLDALQALIETPPLHGRLDLRVNGTFSYVPEANFFGDDSFVYRATDGTASATAAVTLHLAGVNDVPVARDDEYDVVPGQPLVVSTATAGVLGNDTDEDGEPLSAQLSTRPLHGQLDLAPDGTFVYTPEPDFEGSEDALYVARDAQVAAPPARIVFYVGMSSPVGVADRYAAREDEVLDVEASRGVLANDRGRMIEAQLESMPLHGRVEMTRDGAFRYRPELNYAGDDRFTYRATRGALSSEVTEVLLMVEASNDPPSIPRPTLPVDGARVDTGEVTFTWLPSEDPEGEALQYRVRIERDFQVVLVLTSVAPSAIVPSTSALIPGRYLWTVEALDGSGATSGPSPTRTLIVGSGDGPGDGSSPDESGCGCSTSNGAAAPLTALVTLLMSAAVRRRRRP